MDTVFNLRVTPFWFFVLAATAMSVFFIISNNTYAQGTIAIGDRVQVTVGASSFANVRNISGTDIGDQSNGAPGIVTGGPTSLPGQTGSYWNVNFDTGTDGYVLSTALTEVTPPPPLPPPTGGIAIGDRVQVTVSGGSFANVRNISGTDIGDQTNCTLGTVTGGPSTLPGQTGSFWNVNFDTGTDGHVLSTILTEVTIPTSFLFGPQERVRANPGAGLRLNVYRMDSVNPCTGIITSTQPHDRLGIVVDGPRVFSNLTGYYWNINFDSGSDGWVSVDYIAHVVPISTIRAETYCDGRTPAIGVAWGQQTGANGYHIYRCGPTTTTCNPTVIVNTTEITDTPGWSDVSVSPGGKYFYRQRAYVTSPSSFGQYSQIVNVTNRTACEPGTGRGK